MVQPNSDVLRPTNPEPSPTKLDAVSTPEILVFPNTLRAYGDATEVPIPTPLLLPTTNIVDPVPTWNLASLLIPVVVTPTLSKSGDSSSLVLLTPPNLCHSLLVVYSHPA